MDAPRRGLAAPNPGFAGSMPAELDWLQYAPQHSRVLDQTQGTIDKVLAGETVAVFTLDVPLHTLLRVDGLGFGSMSPSALVHAQFKIARDNETLGDYYDMPCIIGTLARPGCMRLFIEGPCTLRLYVTNNYPKTAFRYFARMTGWLVQKVR